MNSKKAKALRKSLGYKPYQTRTYEPLRTRTFGSSTVIEVPSTRVNHEDSLRRLYREAKKELKAGNGAVHDLVS